MSTRDIRTMVGPFGFAFHQVAMYVPGNMSAAMRAYRVLGYNEWHEDRATLRGVRKIGGSWHSVVSEAHMLFNYQAMPMELEFLKYSGGEHRHRDREQTSMIPFISHMSVHVDDVKSTMDLMKSVYGMEPYHLFVTDHHTNPAVKGTKRFVECIYDTRASLGYDVKCIQRIPWASTLEAEELLY